MDMQPLALRFIERIAAIIIGGLAVYFGYRLFVLIPHEKTSDGKVRLPWNISIVLSRVGPGVFFALFGIIAVGTALVRPLEIGAPRTPSQSSGNEYPSIRYMAGSSEDQSARADTRALLRKDMAVLNTISQQLRPDLPKHEKDSTQRVIAKIKLEL